MRLLLDTHIALWAIDRPHLLSPVARDALSGATHVAVSTVAVWEIAIKHRLRRGRGDDIRFSGRDALDLFEQSGLTLLPLLPAHAAAVDTLPMHHGDPFDRVMIAQAQAEPLRFLTADAQLVDYGETVLLA